MDVTSTDKSKVVVNTNGNKKSEIYMNRFQLEEENSSNYWATPRQMSTSGSRKTTAAMAGLDGIWGCSKSRLKYSLYIPRSTHSVVLIDMEMKIQTLEKQEPVKGAPDLIQGTSIATVTMYGA